MGVYKGQSLVQGIKKLVWFSWRGLLHLLILIIIAVVFWSQIKPWVYENGRRGDVMQFVHYTVYEGRHQGLPVSSWDHLWHQGAPRTLDTTWLHYYLIQPLVNKLGLSKAIWLYPSLCFWGLVFFSYCLFFEASGSFLIALGLSLSLIMSQGLYQALTVSGVVTSALSQMFLPAQLYFALRFYQRGGYKNLVWAGIMGALGIYSHGLTMAFFGLLPTGLFILFATKPKKGLITKRTIKNAFIFSVVVLSVGALGFWPTFLHSFFTGGAQSAMLSQFPDFGKSYPQIWQDIVQVTDKGIWWGLGIGLLVGLWLGLKEGWQKQKRLLPGLIIALLVAGWWLSYRLGINRLEWFFFPERIYWIVPVIGGFLAAWLMQPLSAPIKEKNFVTSLIKRGLTTAIKLTVLFLVAWNALSVIRGFAFQPWLKEWQAWQEIDLKAEAMRDYGVLVSQVTDLNDLNQRVWARDEGFTQRWSLISDIPLAQGFFHFGTKRSALWDAWAYEVMSNRTWQTGEVPVELAQQQAKFFIDWYGIKVLWGCLDQSSYCAISRSFYEEKNPLVEKAFVSKNEPPGVVVKIKDDYSSAVMEPAGAVPVVGFVGADNGYRSFVLSLATLGLGSSKLIVLRLGEGLGILNDKTLAAIDGLVINEQPRQGWLDGSAWARLNKFVKEGGKLWVETGGNSVMRARRTLPSVLPITETKFGDLGRTWQLEGEVANSVAANKLSPLEFEGDVWQISYTQPDDLREGAKVLLAQAGKPIAVEKELGSGKVLWTGLNWFYRQDAYRQNAFNEVKPVAIFINRLFGDLPRKRLKPDRIELAKPEKATLTAQGMSGVLYKYNNWPGWTVTAEAGGMKKHLRIYTAGPELMYVSIPQDWQDKPVTVSFQYKGAPFDWICLGVTLLAIGGIAIYLSTGKIILPEKIKQRWNDKKA
jgi:hypothetical protein